MLSEAKKKPRVAAKGLNESLELVNISHSCRTPPKKPLISKKATITAFLKFANAHLDT
uniref:Uncharacterized protein n=1 Tax=Monopterus albus TaxID=43700 RepID=A0A3Q3IWV4_MONAL